MTLVDMNLADKYNVNNIIARCSSANSKSAGARDVIRGAGDAA